MVSTWKPHPATSWRSFGEFRLQNLHPPACAQTSHFYVTLEQILSIFYFVKGMGLSGASLTVGFPSTDWGCKEVPSRGRERGVWGLFGD